MPPDSIDDLVSQVSSLADRVNALEAIKTPDLSDYVLKSDLPAASVAEPNAADTRRLTWVDTVLNKWFSGDAPAPLPPADPIV